MRPSFLTVFILLALTTVLAANAEELNRLYYVQYVQASDDKDHGHTAWKPIGPKLSRVLSPALRWAYFWEVSRKRVKVSSGEFTRVTVSPDYELRLLLRPDAQLELVLYHRSEVRRRVVRSVNDEMVVLGGDLKNKDGWFVVVREDKPGSN
jgi:hypothetical protein